jgi:hypothetical protein
MVAGTRTKERHTNPVSPLDWDLRSDEVEHALAYRVGRRDPQIRTAIH